MILRCFVPKLPANLKLEIFELFRFLVSFCREQFFQFFLPPSVLECWLLWLVFGFFNSWNYFETIKIAKRFKNRRKLVFSSSGIIVRYICDQVFRISFWKSVSNFFGNFNPKTQYELYKNCKKKIKIFNFLVDFGFILESNIHLRQLTSMGESPHFE